MGRKKTKRIKDLVEGDVLSKKDLNDRFGSDCSKKRWDKDKGKWKTIPISKLLTDYKYEVTEIRVKEGVKVIVCMSKRQKVRWIEVKGNNSKKSYIKKDYISSPNIINLK